MTFSSVFRDKKIALLGSNARSGLANGDSGEDIRRLPVSTVCTHELGDPGGTEKKGMFGLPRIHPRWSLPL